MTQHVLWQRAIQSDDIEAARALLKETEYLNLQCVQVFQKDGSWFLLDPLCEAARRDCIPMARLLIEHGRDPNSTTGLAEYRGSRQGAYCLKWAASEEMKQFLMANGADPGIPLEWDLPYYDWESVETGWGDENKQTTNHLGVQWQKVIEAGDFEKAREMLEAHPHLLHQKMVDPHNHWPHDPLYRAAAAGNERLVEFLVNAGYPAVLIRESVEFAAPKVLPLLGDHARAGKPQLRLLAYTGQHEKLGYWLEHGYKVQPGMLHDAVCGRGRFRGFYHDKHHAHWPDGYRETVRTLIAHGADVNERNAGGNKKYEGSKPWRTNREVPLHFAAGNWDANVVQQLLDAGADRTLANDLGETPFDWAVRYAAPMEVVDILDFDGNPRRNPELVSAAGSGDLAKVKRLIEAGADPNSVDENGMGTLLNFHPEVTSYLLEKGANPDNQRNENILPVLGGVSGFNTDCVKLMLDAGADPNIASHHNGETALHHAVCGNDVDLVNALLEAGADPNKRTYAGHATYMLWRDARVRGETPLHRAAAFGSPEIIQRLLDAGADPAKRDANKDTPLSWASWYWRDKSIIDMLAYERSGVGPDYPPADHQPAREVAAPRNDELVSAALSGDLAKVRELIEAGADPNSVDSNGMGPLLNFHPEVTKYLLESGADPDVQRNEDILPVISGVSGNTECVSLMLECGADVNRASDHNGETILHYAASGHNIKLLKMLLDAGANPNARTIPGMRTYAMWRDVRVRGETPLHRAAAWGSAETIQTLLDAGADPANRDANYDTPLSWASWHMRDKSIIDLLSYSGSGIGPDMPTADASSPSTFLPPDHDFIVAVRNVDIPRIRESIKSDAALVDAQVRGDISLTGKVWQDGKRIPVTNDTPQHSSPLHFAAFHGHAELAQLLLDGGANINATARFGGKQVVTPVELAAWEGNVETLRTLLDAGVAANIELQLKPALYTALAHSAKEKVDLLLKHGAEHDIFTAAMAGDLETVTRLLKTDPESVNSPHVAHDRCTPLEEAVNLGQLEVAKLLVEHGAEVPSHVAAAMGQVAAIKLLLEDDPDAATRQFGHQPLLTWALLGGQIEVINLLLDAGADPNGGDRWGVTPLRHVSQVKGDVAVAIVELLVTAGAEVNQESKGFTPLSAARKANNKKVAKALLRNGAIEPRVNVSDG